ncbi:MAG: precorrin-4 C(11)-methyltransferase [Coriobacteriales bacterium]|jgi:precorrin-4/cobalt-precorrin-4 C11-methyltransferase|nr:precorrin-4 C(11)-methyltransferase [Coriobacteriales bacterium]
MIYFVGAGPGAKDLITVRGMRVLSEADCIIYAGSLVNPALLGYASSNCVIHDSASMTLEGVIAVMMDNEQAGLTTARLHTGDPSLYGAIQEQIEILSNQGIAFEVIPGVSAFSGAAAALGVEYTLPGISQSLILTRMAGRTPVPEKESIPALAHHQSSMAIFLSAGMLSNLSAELIEGGYSPDTPAAIVYKATWPDQKIVRTSIAALEDAAASANISRTAIILVGDFLGGEFERSYLYNPSFSHGYRQGSDSDQ